METVMAKRLEHTSGPETDCPACRAMLRQASPPAVATTDVPPRGTTSPATRGECVDHCCGHCWEIECSGACPTSVVADEDDDEDVEIAERDAHDPDTCDDSSCEDPECRFRNCDHDHVRITGVSLDGDNDIAFEVQCNDCGGTNSSYVPRSLARGELRDDWEP